MFHKELEETKGLKRPCLNMYMYRDPGPLPSASLTISNLNKEIRCNVKILKARLVHDYLLILTLNIAFLSIKHVCNDSAQFTLIIPLFIIYYL